MAFANTHLLSRLWLKRGLLTLLASQALPPETSLVSGKTLRSRPQPRKLPSSEPRLRPKPQAPKVQPQVTPLRPPRAFATWPVLWQQLFERVKAGHVVWTYPLLGSDLWQKPSPGLAERRAFLGRLVKEPPVYPQGTHTFWPYQMADAVAQPELFWAGVRQLKASVVMILGLEAGQKLLSRPVVPYSQHHAYGCHVMVFQEIQDLAQNLALYGAMRRMQRDVLAALGLNPVA
ncbi:MAG: hypothetical protein J5846_03330 [Desulfovibrio sp.]|nr:hypothetical protein [Desulfovibrio sp.]